MNKKSGIGDFILLTLEKTVDGYVRVEDFLYNTHIYARGYDRPLKKSSFAKALKRLREQNLIETVNGDEAIIRLTDKGKSAALWEKYKSLKKTWDGKWRIVAFDIPEKYFLVRDLFRRRIKELGFKQLQKSVWISKVDCAKLLRDYVKSLGIEKWVSVIEATSVDFGDKTLFK